MIPGYTHITTKTFTIDDDMLIVGVFFDPKDVLQLHPTWEVTSYEDYKDTSNDGLLLYSGDNWFRAFDVVSKWHERRYQKKLKNVMASLVDMDRFALDMIREARK